MPEQNLPAAAVSRQPCAHARIIHALNCRSSRLNDEPNPDGGDFCPGFGICDCHVSEIERLKVALRIAVEEIQGMEHPETCTFEGTKPVCVACGLTEWCHRRDWKCPNAPEYRWTPREPKPCNCKISSALARIERAKDTGRTE